MYLADTNVISERRKDQRANKGVHAFFRQADDENRKIHLSVIAIAEVRRSIDLARYKGDEKQAFAHTHNCMSCHSITRDSLGPSFKRVAQRYAQTERANTLLARRIAEGGVGNWDVVPMPANTQITHD
ncbi:Cytochrome c551/c552 [Candidatus Paraburkholderia calva]|nr:Cytochrome c551/c552 [Candidatus Paraburkholderia calva]